MRPAVKVTNQAEVAAANERFDHFHDGFFRRISVSKDAELVEVIRADGSLGPEEFWDLESVEIDIYHNNYDYPNQPENRLVRIKAYSCRDIFPGMLQFMGKDVFDLSFTSSQEGISCVLIYHSDDDELQEVEVNGQRMKVRICSLENGKQVALFTAKELEIEEVLYEPRRD